MTDLSDPAASRAGKRNYLHFLAAVRAFRREWTHHFDLHTNIAMNLYEYLQNFQYNNGHS